MARRTARGADKAQATSSSGRSHTPEAAGKTEAQADSEKCPACSDDTRQSSALAEKESWILCEACKVWYHWSCVGNGDDLNNIGKWFCKSCQDTDPSRVITYRAPTRKSSRKRVLRDYGNLNAGVGSDPSKWTRMLEGKTFTTGAFKRMHGNAVTLSWLEKDENAFREPTVIEKPDGLGLAMPPRDLSVRSIAQIVGEDTPLEVIDVASQSTSPGWTLGKWADYVNLEPSRRERILNVISLEISGTKLADAIAPPKFVRELDWVENFWPNTRKGKGFAYPKVQLYCLMGVASAWTDWHIDFAGSSVYYHILRGSKVFYFIRPTPANLAAYEKWSGTDLQTQSWLGDLVDEVHKVELVEGNTMMIPSGWIHAVYTPVDTLVFGGNFLHSFDVPTQLKVRNIEIATQVPKKFRFPMFSRLCWYVGEKYLRDLKANPSMALPGRTLDSLLALADFLVSEARLLERGPDHAKKEIKEQIPSDRVKDPSLMARELRWKLRLAGEYASEDEGHTRKGRESGIANGHGHKRRRIDSENWNNDDGLVRFKHFKPKIWDGYSGKTQTDEIKVRHAPKPGEDNSWSQDWLDKMEIEDEGDKVRIETRRDVVIKVRRTTNGCERHRIERVIEHWTWDDEKPQVTA